MARVFLSHSSRDSRQAIAVKKWMVEQEPGLADEIFLDLDPHTGIRPGERWKQALQQANSRCEAVICLLWAHWEASHECTTEFRYAETFHKAIVCARLEPVPAGGITSEWQRCDLFTGDGPTTAITVDAGEPVVLASKGLHRLLDGLDLEALNRRLVAERDARAIEADAAKGRVAELEDELSAARESLRRVIKSHNRPQ